MIPFLLSLLFLTNHGQTVDIDDIMSVGGCNMGDRYEMIITTNDGKRYYHEVKDLSEANNFCLYMQGLINREKK